MPLEEIEEYKQANKSSDDFYRLDVGRLMAPSSFSCMRPPCRCLYLTPVWRPQAVAAEIQFMNWSKELKSFMQGKKMEDYLIRDRP